MSSFPVDEAGIGRKWPSRRLGGLLVRNDSGVWGDEPNGQSDTLVLRSTDQTVDGEWRIEDPAARCLAPQERVSARLALGDLVVTKSSGSALHIGKTSLVDKQVAASHYCFSNFMQRLRPGSMLSPKFLWYFMNSPLAREQLGYYSSTTTGLANLNGGTIGRVELPLPPASTQSVIANYLDSETARIDTLIDRKQRFIDLLLEKRGALITHAVTKGVDPNVEVKDSGIPYFGDVPATWSKDKLGRIGTMSGGCTPSKEERRYWDGEIPWVTPKDMKVRRLADSIDHVTDEALAETSLGVIEPGAILIVVRGMILARFVPVALNDVPVTVNQDMKAIRVSPGRNPEYILYMLEGLSAALQTIVEEAAHGTRCLRTEAWNAFAIMLPSHDEQARIVATLDEETRAADALLEKTRRSIDLLREYRTALISAAVTGQIDIPGTDASEEVA